jgi:AcrR family transcriptional regulator
VGPFPVIQGVLQGSFHALFLQIMSTCNDQLVGAAAGTAYAAETAIMDAARECVLAFGVRRTSLSDVARRARRWPDRTALVADVMTREWARVITGARPAEAGFATVREHLVAHVIAGVQAMRAHPLFQKITDVDPDLLLPYIFDRLGTSQLMVAGFLAGRIAAGQQEGSVRAGEPGVLARLVLLAVQSCVLSAGLTADVLSEPQLAAELAVLLDRYLRPGQPP